MASTGEKNRKNAVKHIIEYAEIVLIFIGFIWVLGGTVAPKTFLILGKEFIPPNLTIDPIAAMIAGLAIIFLMPIYSKFVAS